MEPKKSKFPQEFDVVTQSAKEFISGLLVKAMEEREVEAAANFAKTPAKARIRLTEDDDDSFVNIELFESAGDTIENTNYASLVCRSWKFQ